MEKRDRKLAEYFGCTGIFISCCRSTVGTHSTTFAVWRSLSLSHYLSLGTVLIRGERSRLSSLTVCREWGESSWALSLFEHMQAREERLGPHFFTRPKNLKKWCFQFKNPKSKEHNLSCTHFISFDPDQHVTHRSTRSSFCISFCHAHCWLATEYMAINFDWCSRWVECRLTDYAEWVMDTR